MWGTGRVADAVDPLEGVPQSGRDRLELNKAGLFTSDLTVNEYLLVEDAGFEPLGLVSAARSTRSATSASGGTAARS